MRAKSADSFAVSAADLSECRRSLRGGSHSFFAASLLLPAAVRAPAGALYAFCRMADDAIDLAADSAAALAGLRERLDRAAAGRPDADPADRAFAATMARFGIPRALPEALLEGFEWDVNARRYPDFDALCAYGARVAGTVGAMMALIMGARSPAALARACELGVAMQLTNIARDVGEDARMGRLYLPLDWMRAEGLDPDAFLAAPSFDERLAAVLRRLLAEADRLYARGVSGVASLPAGCRPAIRAAAALYAEIGREVERRGLDSVSGRAVVSPLRKLVALGRGLPPLPGSASATPLPAIAFLVDAAVSVPRAAGRAPIPWWRIQERTIRIIEMFERLAERDQLGGSRT